MHSHYIYMFETHASKAVTRVSFLVRQEVWGSPRSPAGPGQSLGKGSRGGLSPHEALALFEIARYFGYENDRTHVIKVVVLVVKIIIQLTYGIHVFKKKKHTTTSLFNGDARTKSLPKTNI